MKKKRVALFTPMPPSHSGIADYNAELIPLLRQHYDLDIFVHETPENFSEQIYSHSRFYFRHKSRRYDVILYHIGNNARYHEYMYSYLFQFPGAVMFHDCCLHHSRAGMLLTRGMFDEYKAELEYSHGIEAAEAVPRMVLRGAAGDLLMFSFPMARLILMSSLAAAAHTQPMADELKITDTPVIKIPHLILKPALPLQMKLFPGKFVVGSFGLATRAKRLLPVMQAMSQLRRYYPNLLYLIAGGIEAEYDIDAQLKATGITDITVKTGRTELNELLGLMHRADAVVNLRFPFAGEMSSILIRAMSEAKPVLITGLRYYSEFPEDAVLRIRPDNEVDDIFRALSRLIESPLLCARIGAAAKRYIETNNSIEQAVDKYRELIELAFERKSSFTQPPLPRHLQSGREIMREYILRTSLDQKTDQLLDLL